MTTKSGSSLFYGRSDRYETFENKANKELALRTFDV